MFTLENNAGDDIIDVRDIIARIDELEGHVKNGGMDDLADEKEELATLLAFMDEIKGMGGDEQWRGDWYPVTLIYKGYFEEAMDEMVKDCYDIDAMKLPAFLDVRINYDMLQGDYTSAELDGNTYWMR